MARFAISTPVEPNSEKIKKRIMELFSTADELKKLFNDVLPKNSLLKSILKIDEQQDKDKICDTLLAYIGNNFFYTVGQVKSEEENKLSELKKEKKRIQAHGRDIKTIENEIKELEKKTNKNYIRNLIREKFLEQYCKFQKENSESLRQEIITSYNDIHKTSFTTFEQVANGTWKDKWQKELCYDYLLFPDSVFEKPETISQLPTTIPLKTKSKLSQLYDFQTRGLIKIHNYLSDKEDRDQTEKRTLIMMPTGSGKTRMTVQALVEWLNLRDQGKIDSTAHEQQLNKNGIIFWFASTNELCDQASDSFREIFNQIGTSGLVNLTHWYGNERPDLPDILNNNPGTHIIITNTIHANDELAKEKGEGTRRIDYWENSEYYKFVRKNTITIVIDEAHEVTGEGYQNFLAAMGFDYSGRNVEKINKNNIVLIGLSATPYKGSGIRDESSSEDIDDLDDFMNMDTDKEPAYFKNLDKYTRLIHKIFGRIFVPIPERSGTSSHPIAMINAPHTAYVGDSIKISGTDSYDLYSDITFSWKTFSFGGEKIPDHTEPEFYQQFKKEGTYQITLEVKNGMGFSSKSMPHVIEILPTTTSQIKGTGSLEDTQEFYNILTNDRKILCEITHGVIDGPQLNLSKKEFAQWKKGTLEDSTISNDEKYNRQICDVVDKCIKKYNKKRVLIFANSVKHSQELRLILRVNYGHENAESVDGTTKTGIRRKIVKEFRETENIPILCNYGVFTTGFDVPKIDVLIICRDVGSNALYTQMIGRGQRGPVAHGTEDLWLITSDFPKPNQTKSELKLGWEALAEDWKSFPQEIKENLGLRDFKYESNVTTRLKQPEAIKDDFLINEEPITNLQVKCQTCSAITNGLDNCLKFYGYKSTKEGTKAESVRQVIKLMKKDKKDPKAFHRHCAYCRASSNLIKSSNCTFTKFIGKYHNGDAHLVVLANVLQKMLENKHQNIIKWHDLQNELWHLWNKNANKQNKVFPKNFFNLNMPAIKRLEENNILKIKKNLDIEIIDIVEPKGLKQVIDNLKVHPQIKNKAKQIIDTQGINEKNLEFTNIRKIPKLEQYFIDLKKTIGHTPTSRQFNSELGDLKKEYIKQYNGDYKDFLKTHGIILKDDEILKDSLYDEYFEKCITEGKKITHKQLDEYGDYRLEDYRDMWGTVENFEQKTSIVLEDVLKHYDELRQNRDAEFEEILKDIQELKKKRPATFYRFDEIYQHSKLKVFRYVIQLKISHLRYLENYHRPNVGIFLQLVSDFFRLKKWIGRTPKSAEEFSKKTGTLATSNFMKEFKITREGYEKFLHLIDVDFPEKEDPKVEQKMKEKTIEKLKKYEKDYEREKTEFFIDAVFNPNDELSVLIETYFPNKKELKKLLWPD